MGKFCVVFSPQVRIRDKRCAEQEVNPQYLYYMYEKSSKKARELKELFSILNEVYAFENQEVKPHRATGTRWIAHILKSLKNYSD